MLYRIGIANSASPKYFHPRLPVISRVLDSYLDFFETYPFCELISVAPCFLGFNTIFLRIAQIPFLYAPLQSVSFLTSIPQTHFCRSLLFETSQYSNFHLGSTTWPPSVPQLYTWFLVLQRCAPACLLLFFCLYY